MYPHSGTALAAFALLVLCGSEQAAAQRTRVPTVGSPAVAPAGAMTVMPSAPAPQNVRMSSSGPVVRCFYLACSPRHSAFRVATRSTAARLLTREIHGGCILKKKAERREQSTPRLPLLYSPSPES